jgi:hypothetical protein
MLCCAAAFTGLAAILLHFAFLFFNIMATWLLRFPEKERKAIIVMASQKNLPTAAGGFCQTHHSNALQLVQPAGWIIHGMH